MTKNWIKFNEDNYIDYVGLNSNDSEILDNIKVIFSELVEKFKLNRINSNSIESEHYVPGVSYSYKGNSTGFKRLGKNIIVITLRFYIEDPKLFNDVDDTILVNMFEFVYSLPEFFKDISEYGYDISISCNYKQVGGPIDYKSFDVFEVINKLEDKATDEIDYYISVKN